MGKFVHYKPQNFEKIATLTKTLKWRVKSNIRFSDLKKKVDRPEATVHVCKFCKSTSFQVHEVVPPRSTTVPLKLVVTCLNCGQWYNLDKYTYR